MDSIEIENLERNHCIFCTRNSCEKIGKDIAFNFIFHDTNYSLNLVHHHLNYNRDEYKKQIIS